MQHDLDLCFGCMEESSGEAVCPHCGYSADAPYLPAYLAPGSLLNHRYIAGRLLSHNGESAVYIGYDKMNSVKVFIREYMPVTLCHRVKDSTVVAVNQNAVAQYKTFMSEFVELNKTLARLRNLSHINPAIDMFGDNNTGYVIFNYIEGRPLTDILRDSGGTMSWGETKKFFPPVFTTLSLIHNAGLIHRGICPDNIIVTAKNDFFIDNFCVADERTAETELSSEIFDGYAAPEQYSTVKWQGTWTDVYGICALLYRILTGVTPQIAPERERTDELVSPHELNEDIPMNVSDVIMNGMLLNSNERIQTVTELVTGLFSESESTKLSRTEPVIVSRNKRDDNYERYYGYESFGQEEEYEEYDDYEEYEERRPRPVRRSKKSGSGLVVFGGFAAAVVLVAILAVVMLAVNDDSFAIADRISLKNEETTMPPVRLDELAESLSQQTEPSEMTENSQPTLNEVENSENTMFTDGNESVYIMNDIVGKNYETIKNSPTYKSLSFLPEYEFNEEAKKGTIISQSIEKGETYKAGEKIVIKVSLGSRYVKIPDYIGLKAEEYINLLEGKNIKYEQVSYDTRNTKDGYVCGISPEDEIMDLESGDTLIVYVAYNPAPATTTTEATTEETTEETTKKKKKKKKVTETEPPEEVFTEEPDIDYDNYDDEEYIDDDIIIDDPDFYEVD